jgi:hypothetical protein
MSFAELKRNSKSNFEALNNQLSKLNTSTKTEDDTYWKPTRDKAGNGFAIIRFLPAKEGEDSPFVRIWDHGFQGPGGWYIENSLTTIGQQDAIAEYNSKLWNSGVDSDKEIARKQKRRLSFHSNIRVIKDPANPENDGKEFKYKYGKKIFDKLNDSMNPVEDPLDPKEPVNPFDMWTGANFKLKIRTVDGFPNYDKSEFESPSVLGTDEELEEIYSNLYSLQVVIHPKNFKSPAELQARLTKVLGFSTSTNSVKGVLMDDEEIDQALPAPKQKAKAAPKADSSSDDDDLAFFQKLAEEE